MKALLLLVLSIVGMNIYAKSPTEHSVAQRDVKVENISLKVGESLTRELRSLPGAGFLWMVRFDDKANREVVHIDKQSEPAQEGLIGGPVTEYWTFKAVQPGKAKITLEYARPSDQSMLSDTIILNFDVTD